MNNKPLSSEKITKREKSLGWDVAARDARRQIEEARARIASLERSLRICEKKKADGEPWPGAGSVVEQSATQN